MQTFAIVDYSLVIIFFICITGLLLLGVHAEQRQVPTSAKLPALRQAPESYLFLAVLFLLFIILTLFSERRVKQSSTFG